MVSLLLRINRARRGASDGANALIHAPRAGAILFWATTMKVIDNPNQQTERTAEFFDGHSFETLAAVCARLIPQPDREPFLGIARTIDHRLAEQAAGRWPRFPQFSDPDTCRLGLQGLDELSRARLRCDFVRLDPVRQDQILFSLQTGAATGGIWTKISARRFFEELLHEATELYHTAPVTEEAV
jgi:hypothetical protein